MVPRPREPRPRVVHPLVGVVTQEKANDTRMLRVPPLGSVTHQT